MEEYKVLKHTPCGVWVERWPHQSMFDNSMRFIKERDGYGHPTRKRYAYPTEEEALESFMIRKRLEIGYCKQRLDNARKAMAYAESMLPRLGYEEINLLEEKDSGFKVPEFYQNSELLGLLNEQGYSGPPPPPY
jgi:hypothetical protein